MNTRIAVVLMALSFTISTAATAGDPAAGEAIYNKTCKLCHASGMMGAPKPGDKAAWAPRIAKGEDALLASAINGFNKMPPRGTCKDCSDEDLKNAIAYMVEQSK